jgi:hypothetical protein
MNVFSYLDVAVVKGSFIVCTPEALTKHDLINGKVEIIYENFFEPNSNITTANIDIHDNLIAVPIGNKLKFWQLNNPKVCTQTFTQYQIMNITTHHNTTHTERERENEKREQSLILFFFEMDISCYQ